MKGLLKLIVPLAICFSATFISTASAENNTWISEEAQQQCITYGEEYGICPELLMAIIEQESSGQADAENGICKGLMQISEKWHKDRMDKLNADIYEDNVLIGTDYLAELFAENEDVYWVLMAYNGGIEYANRMYEEEKYSKYAVSIANRSAELERMHGK